MMAEEVRTPFGMALVRSFTADGEEWSALCHYLKRNTDNPMQAIGLLMKASSILIAQTIIDGEADREITDCTVILRSMIEFFRDGVDVEQFVERKVN